MSALPLLLAVSLLAAGARAADPPAAGAAPAGGPAVVAGAQPADKSEGAAPHAPSELSVELHHSLHRPLDKTQVYWNYGGSTVMTRDFIRLTPSAQNRKGWLWNDYPIESPNWEVEFELEVKSKPHFGGDGLAFWLLDGKQDPTYHSDVAYLSGDVFGLKRDFKGVGVVFDVYDNDGKRDNPSIFVLYNPDGAPVTYNHDLDYKDGMYKRVAAGPNSAYSCVANIRNTPTPTKVMVKFLHKILHVYVDTDDGLGYKFCLAVAFDAPFANHHIAFTAMTGQVADTMDLLTLSTKYLTEDAEEIDDSLLRHADDHQSCSTMHTLFWGLIVLATGLLLALAAYELNNYRTMTRDQLDKVVLCAEMNRTLVPHLFAYYSTCVLLLLGAQVKALLLNAPLLAWRLYQQRTGAHVLNPAVLATVSLPTRLSLTLAAYVVFELFYLYKWFDC